MATRTISVAGGNWSDVNAWDEGATPTAADDVVARPDGTSGNLTNDVTNQACRSLDFTNYSGTWTIGAINLNIGTSSAGPSNVALKLSSTMTLAMNTSATVTFVTTQAAQTITCNGKRLTGRCIISSAGGGIDLADAFYGSIAATTTGSLTFTNGDFNSQGFAISCNTLQAAANSNTRAVTLSNSTITMAPAASATIFNEASTGNLTLTMTGTIFNVTVTSGTLTWAGGTSRSYPTVNFTWNAGNVTVTATTAITFAAMTFDLSGAATTRTLTLPASVTCTFTAPPYFLGKTSAITLSVKSSSAGTATTISCTTGVVRFKYATVQDLTLSGGAVFVSRDSTIGTGMTGLRTITNTYSINDHMKDALGAGDLTTLLQAHWAANGGYTMANFMSKFSGPVASESFNDLMYDYWYGLSTLA